MNKPHHNFTFSYSWPGNVRELKNMMQQVSLLCEGRVVRKDDLDPCFSQIQSVTAAMRTLESKEK